MPSTSRAAILADLADLAVAPLPASAIADPIVAADPVHGLPPIEDYSLGLVVGREPTKPVLAAADHLRACFSARAGRMPRAA